MLDRRNFYINGEWAMPDGAPTLDVIDPATEDAVATISIGRTEDADRAVAAARAAFPDWAATPVAKRIKLLRRLEEIYHDRRDDMAEAIRMEMGAPIDYARNNQWGAGSWHMGGFFDALEKFAFEERFTDEEVHVYEPIGVCGLITPWNWPMNQVVLKVIPALAMGNTAVLKPSEIAPLSSLLFAEMVDAAGFPDGVFNLVNGDGAGVGARLSEHPDIDMVSFTGSTRAGRLISQAAAGNLKRVSLELGGKGANIVFADADADAVARGVLNCMSNSGQSCNAPTRMLVERSRYDAAVEEARATAESIATGPTTEHGDHIGPVISELQFDKIQGLIETGIAEGARLLAGGAGRPEGRNRGFYVRPTVFADVTPDMTIFREEIFGPVLSITPFDTEQDAIDLANDTAYGLTNYIQTEDTEKRIRVAKAVRAGMVETNGIEHAQGSPFGGYKMSGNGREGGVHGLREFSEVKAITGWPA
ncbi:aldehyde dehydrogenase (NAD+) [Poseidonocella pacifica]|uniref:Aldehyde dehydrogenase (NAD+) n=1 Tax=Poseidonocella pacifica TaxID=871651 RepID=A0A1I0WJT6_9RHOB|nr:aldehyde dehydrogenase family protein [Poseidonocella pacifica]SFA88814.1 aldehyde dehydrogenase (NAD+) [Poseidonocella pacifica]